MGVAAIPLALAGGYMQGKGAQSQQKAQNQFYKQAAGQMNPGNIYSNSRALNPGLMNALGMPGYNQAMMNMAQNPGYIDPSLMNMPFHMSSMRAGQDMNRAQSILGKTLGGTGVSGMGNAYALANQAGRTARDVQTAQQYTQLREQQKRADLAFLQQQLMGTLGLASGNAGTAAGFLSQQRAPMNNMQIGGNMMQGGLGAFAPFMQQLGGGGNQSYAAWLNQGNQGPPGIGWKA